MNKRIKQLAEQAYVTVLTTKGMEDIVDGCYIISPDKLDKFAELIVQECSRVAKLEVGTNRVCDAIEKHFGVES